MQNSLRAMGMVVVVLTGFVTAQDAKKATAPEADKSDTRKDKIVPFSGDLKTVRLPASIKDIVAGGGGRYLIMHLAQLRQLAIFDTSKGGGIRQSGVWFAAELRSQRDDTVERRPLALGSTG